MSRLIDPISRTRSLAARSGGLSDMRDVRRALRELGKRNAPESDLSPAPDAWSVIEEVEELPEVDEDVVGRIFLKKNDDSDDVLSAGITAADGTPVLVGLSTIGSDTAISLFATSILTGISAPEAVTLDSSGNMFASFRNAASDYRIRKYSPTLSLLWTCNPIASGISIDEVGHMDVGSTSVLITQFDAVSRWILGTGALEGYTGIPGTANSVFRSPIGIYHDGTNYWIVDSNNDRVRKYFPATSTYTDFDGSTSGLTFVSPTGIASDGTYIYVLDPVNARIVKFLQSTMAWDSTIQLTNGNGDGQISTTANSLDIDASGRIWISDTDNHRIQVFSSAGAFLGKIGSYGTAVGQFKNPRQLSFNAARTVAYVADRGNDRIVTVREDTGLITPVVTARSISTSIAAGATSTLDALCNAGEVAVGGGYDGTSAISVDTSRPLPSSGTPTGWRVVGTNSAGGARTLVANVVCMKVPLELRG